MSKLTTTCGIDLGGMSIRVDLFDAAIHLVDSSSMPTRVGDGPDRVVTEMASAVRLLMEKHSIVDLGGIGIGSPGPINLRTGMLELLSNLPGWENYQLRNELARASGISVSLKCDPNATAIAEWKLGAGQSARLYSLAMVTLGTGVGSGLILNGRVWHGMGGEVGHAIILPDGDLCGCGSRGCLEMYASAGGFCRLPQRSATSPHGTVALRAPVHQPAGFTPKDVAELAERRDVGSKQAFHDLGRYFGLGIANLISTLDLPMGVVGGGLASAWSLFAPSMFQAILEHSVIYRLVQPSQSDTLEPDHTFIVPARLGPCAGLQGAAMLPRLMADTAAQNTYPSHEVC